MCTPGETPGWARPLIAHASAVEANRRGGATLLEAGSAAEVTPDQAAAALEAGKCREAAARSTVRS